MNELIHLRVVNQKFIMKLFTKIFFFFIILLISINAVNSQAAGFPAKPIVGTGKIDGLVVDSLSGEVISFASVVLREALEHKEMDGVLTDDVGGFKFKELKNAKYEIVISFLGYKTKIVGPYKINKDIQEHKLGTILLSQDTKLLEAVTVTGQKEIIENKIDRMVYNADRDVTSRGGTAEDVLRRTPMLTVDLEGNVSLRGSSNITVLINGKPSSLMANSVKDAIKMIPADVIQKVEVITQPGAKYDAEGTAGIINIVTKTKKIKGKSGAYNVSAGTRSSYVGTNFSIRQGNIGYTANIGGYMWRGYSRTTIDRFNKLNSETINLDQSATAHNIGGGLYAQASVDYDITDKHNLNFGLRTPVNIFSNTNRTTTAVGINEAPVLFDFRREGDILNRTLGTDINAEYKRTYGKDSDREYSASAQYSINNGRTKYDVNQFDSLGTLNYAEKGPNSSYNKELTIATDYLHPVNKLITVEVGAKGIFRNVTSDIYYDTLSINSGLYLRDNRRNNYLNYDQNVFAGYGQITFPIYKKITGRVGLRFEETFINANIQNETSFKNDYPTWVPSALISYISPKNWNVKGSYSRRIQRPSMNYLNPYINFNDPTNISYGNPNLSPELTESFEVQGGYSKNMNNINLALYHKITSDLIDNYRFVDSNGITNSTYNNLSTSYSSGASINGGIFKLGKIIVNSSINLFYQKINSERFKDVKNDGFNFTINGFGLYYLSKTWSVTLFTLYNSPKLTTQGKQGTWYVYSLGARKEIWKQKGAFSFGIDNPFETWMPINSEFSSSEFGFNSRSKFEARGIRAGFEYRFGQMDFGQQNSKKKKKGFQNDDLKQDENNSGGGGRN
ncbi:MAG: TonB-dependent receptor [Saprospiraceae bacterium]|nr:TonB-dependent receptor [Saprospiraceae bacterium]